MTLTQSACTASRLLRKPGRVVSVKLRSQKVSAARGHAIRNVQTQRKSTVDIESELPQAKRVRFEEGTPRRSEGRARRKLQLVAFKKYLPATFYAPGEGFSHETRYQAEHDRAEVLQERNRQGTSECQEGLHANKNCPQKKLWRTRSIFKCGST